MAFINQKEALLKARSQGYAIGAFNVYNLETVQAVAKAAEDMHSPVIFQVTPSAIDYAGLNQIFDIVVEEIDARGLKASIHLDHAKDFGIVKACIDEGFGSVMIDGSALPLHSNIALTEKVVNYAREYGVSVEAEIGKISKAEGGELAGKSELTDPNEAKNFVDATGVDSLAVAIGNEHGAPKGEKLNLELLKQISALITVPIVIHGSSGLSQKDIRSAIGAGAVKFNIDTKIRRAFLTGIKESIGDENDPRVLLSEVKADIVKLVKDYIKIFGSENAKI